MKFDVDVGCVLLVAYCFGCVIKKEVNGMFYIQAIFVNFFSRNYVAVAS